MQDFSAWCSAQDLCLEETKKRLKTLSDRAKEQEVEMPDEWREVFAGFTKIRNRGLLKLKNIAAEILSGANEIPETAHNLLRQTIETID